MSEARRAARNSVSPFPRSADHAASGGRARPRLGDLNDRLGYFVRRLQLWIFQDFIRTMAEVDVSPAQFAVLAVIEENPGLSQADVADTLGIERARLVRLLHRLETREFLERRPSPSDRRSHALFLTRDGRRRMKHLRALANAHETRVAERLGPANRRVLLGILRAFSG